MKLIIFDLDGVLVDLREVHYKALNSALWLFKQPKISKEDHENKFNGLSTKQKLEILGVPADLAVKIYENKQRITSEEVLKLEPDKRLQQVLSDLKLAGYILACASNSIRSTVKNALLKTGLLEYIDFYFSNEDVKNPKPSPEIYYRCMIAADVGIEETIIVEDGKYGREAAIKAGADLRSVTSPEEVTYELLS